MKKSLLILFTIVLTLALAMPAMAILHYEHAKGQRIDMDAFIVFPMYGSSTKYSSDQKNNQGGCGTSPCKNDTDLTWTHWSDSRVTTTLTSGDLSGTWQFGVPDDFQGVVTRLLNATWTINDYMSLSVGKMYAPYYFWGNSRLGGDLGEFGYGSNWDDFDPGVSLNVMGFYVYLKSPVYPGAGHANSPANDYFTDNSDVDIDRTIPRAYIGYNSPRIADRVSFMTALGYNTFKLNSNNNRVHKSINAWAADLYADVKIMDAVSVRGGGMFGNNFEEMGFPGYDTPGGTSATAGALIDNRHVKDTRTVSAFGEVVVNIGKVTAMTGYGYSKSKNPKWRHSDNQQTYFIRAEIPIFEHESGANITIQPEINLFDDLKASDGTNQEKQINAGIIAQVHF